MNLQPAPYTKRKSRILDAADNHVGFLKPGLAADITVFDPQTIAPQAIYEQPAQLAKGVCHVIVGGGVAMENGLQTDYRGGKFLRKPQSGR